VDHRARMARVYGTEHVLLELLGESLDPRGPDMLLDVAGEYLAAGDRILDAGCRDARYLIPLVQRYDCSGVGFDPVERNIERARAAVEAAGLGDRIQVDLGVMEQIEQPDDSFDFVWSRDVLPVIEGLEVAFAEAARVLRPDGAMLVYTNFATELLLPSEALALHEPLGNTAGNLDEEFVEGAFEHAGLAVERKDVIGTEWREYEEEHDQRVSGDLLRLARLRRRRTEIVERLGQEEFDVEQASLHWRAYQFLGKLQPVLYILRAKA
jgi:SAM-dependent methyltransferase